MSAPNAQPPGYCFLRPLLVLPYRPNAREHTLAHKIVITGIVSIAAASAPLGSTVLLPALSAVARDFHTTPTVVNLSIALYSQAVAITPLWWSSLAETRGRRPVYLLSFFLALAFNTACAVSTSISMFLVFRILAGATAASVQAVGAATVADVWDLSHRGRAMGAFFLGPMVGPLVAPILGGAVSHVWGWRATQWVMVIYSGPLWLAMMLFLPETSAKAKASRRADPSNKGTPMWRRGLRALILPVKVVPLLRRPALFATVYYASIVFMSYYFLNISIETTFSRRPYDFNTLIVGLMYVSPALGYLLTGVFGGRWTDYVRRQRQAKRSQAVAVESDDAIRASQTRPHDAIGANAWFAAALFPGALLWYGWTADKHVFWLVPCIANFFFGVGNMMIVNVTTIMLTELVKDSPSTGVALNNLLRNTLACGAAIAAAPLMNAIGDGWLFTALALICWASSSSLLLLQLYSDRWEEKAARKAEQ